MGGSRYWEHRWQRKGQSKVVRWVWGDGVQSAAAKKFGFSNSTPPPSVVRQMPAASQGQLKPSRHTVARCLLSSSRRLGLERECANTRRPLRTPWLTMPPYYPSIEARPRLLFHTRRGPARYEAVERGVGKVARPRGVARSERHRLECRRHLPVAQLRARARERPRYGRGRPARQKHGGWCVHVWPSQRRGVGARQVGRRMGSRERALAAKVHVYRITTAKEGV